MSKRHITSQKGFEPPDKICKVEIQKNPKLCCFRDFDTTELCPECWNDIHILLKNPCPSRKCNLSICDDEFHLHCYQNYISEMYRYTDQIDFLRCLYC